MTEKVWWVALALTILVASLSPSSSLRSAVPLRRRGTRGVAIVSSRGAASNRHLLLSPRIGRHPCKGHLTTSYGTNSCFRAKDERDELEEAPDPELLSSPLPLEGLSPPLSFSKYMTMLEKRPQVTIRYTGGVGLRQYYLTLASYLQENHPDCVLSQLILPYNKATKVFEVNLDGKVILGRTACKDLGRDVLAVRINTVKFEAEIAKARRRRRPGSAYNRGSGISS